MKRCMKFIIKVFAIILCVLLVYFGVSWVEKVMHIIGENIVYFNENGILGRDDNWVKGRDENCEDSQLMGKPVIYLYPEQETEISVKLTVDGELTCTYPPYNSGWSVTAKPDGTLTNHADNKEYSYLFWEGKTKNKFDMSKGFVVKGSDTASFLQEKLAYMGLTPKEYNEFIVFWLPILQENEYNLIAFQGKAYTDTAKLEITPKPDSVLRVYMAYQPLDKAIAIEKQELQTFERKGFTVAEWGGGIAE